MFSLNKNQKSKFLDDFAIKFQFESEVKSTTKNFKFFSPIFLIKKRECNTTIYDFKSNKISSLLCMMKEI